ncbi:MAG: hypothetical protein JNM79_18825 [Burkholderiales bacterium]|nr:hypothetical protein [Burkholderiales bacterium]
MSVRLARWSLHVYALPYRREIVWANAVERQGLFALFTLTGDNGARGVAEATIKPTWSGVSPTSLKATLADVLMPRLEGVDVSSPAAVAAALAGVPENRFAKGLIDTAAWTLQAATRGEPLWRTWGGTREVDLTWAVTRQAPTKMATEAEEVCSRYGFRTLKVKGGQGVETDLAAMRAIRAAVGDAVELYVDANSAYPREAAAEYVAAIAAAGATVAEDPCPLWPDDTFDKLQAGSPIPLLVDRNCTSVEDAQAFLDRGARGLSTKPGRIGLSAARAIAELAAARGTRVAIGLYGESALGTLISLQQAAALPRALALVAAEQTFFLEMTAQVLGSVPAIAEGRLQLPAVADLAGLIDPDAVERYRVGGA